MPRLKPNPFRYGKPVTPSQFIGRRDILHTLFARILNNESTAVVGPAHMGKSSLLRYLADEQVRGEWIPGEAIYFVELDCHLLPEQHQPVDLWEMVVQQLEASSPAGGVLAALEAARRHAFDPIALERLFRGLGAQGTRVALLVDEFETLLHHPNFNRAGFFGPLRSISSRTEGLVLVIASRLSLAEMNRRSQQLLPLGSPFFNTWIEVRLPPLQRSEAEALLDQALRSSGVAFSEEERSFLWEEAGPHPYLFQAAAAALFDSMQQGAAGEERLAAARALLSQRVSAFCEEIWGQLAEPARQALRGPAQGGARADLSSSLAGLGFIEDSRTFWSWLSTWSPEHLVAAARGGSMPATAPVRLYYSYCDQDATLCGALDKHLALLQRQGVVSVWERRKLLAGSASREEGDQELARADIILLLVSADFLGSAECAEEMGRALERQRTGAAVVVPILLRPADLQFAPFSTMQHLPRDGRPVTLWGNQDAAWRDVAEGIRRLALGETLSGRQPHALPTLTPAERGTG